MRGQLGYMFYKVAQLKRRGELPANYNPFPPAFLATCVGAALAVIVLAYGVSLILP
jgi:hypothetical protein